MAAAMPCKRKAQTSTTKAAVKQKIASHKIHQNDLWYGCMVESHESTRQRVESSQPKNHEDHIAGKGFTSMTHYSLVHKRNPMPQVMKIPDAKAAVDKEWKKLETIPSWQLEKVKSRKRLLSKHKETKKESPRCYIDEHMPHQKSGVRTKIIDVQRQSRAPW